jgi:hypothetical protein
VQDDHPVASPCPLSLSWAWGLPNFDVSSQTWYGIRSERRLVEDVHLNLAYRWFCKLGLPRFPPPQTPFKIKAVVEGF